MNQIRSKQKQISCGFFVGLILFGLVVFSLICCQIKDVAQLGDAIADLKASLNQGWGDSALEELLDVYNSSYLANSITVAFKFIGAIAVIVLAGYGLFAILKNKGYKVSEFIIAISLLITVGNYLIYNLADLIVSGKYGDISNFTIALFILSIFSIIAGVIYLVLLIKGKNEFLRKGFAWASLLLIIGMNITEMVNICQVSTKDYAVPLCIEIFIFLASLITICELVFIGEEININRVEVKHNKKTILSCDPYEKLEKLKDLLDKGIISEEEYNQKRQKYVDML